MEQVTRYILDHTKAGDYVYVCPRGPYNITTGRRNPTRFDRIEWALTPTLRREMVSAVESRKTPYIVYIKPPHPYNTVFHSEQAYFLDEMLEEIGRNYVAEAQFPHTILFRKRGASPIIHHHRDTESTENLEITGFKGLDRAAHAVIPPEGSFRIREVPKGANRVSFEVRLGYPPFLGNIARPKIFVEVLTKGKKMYEASIVVPTFPEFSSLSFHIPPATDERELYFRLVHGGALNPLPRGIQIRKIRLERDPVSILCNGY
ncbi:MAG: hypothetical protein HYU64_14280 [Armatimonadetes bacterium]|nr:hypothetical protein [Armatimonadota bacterium]